MRDMKLNDAVECDKKAREKNHSQSNLHMAFFFEKFNNQIKNDEPFQGFRQEIVPRLIKKGAAEYG